MCKRILPGVPGSFFRPGWLQICVQCWSLDSVLCPRGPLNFSHTSLLPRASLHIISQSMTDASSMSHGILREGCGNKLSVKQLTVLPYRVVSTTPLWAPSAVTFPATRWTSSEGPCCSRWGAPSHGDKAHCPVSLSATHSAALQHLCHKLHSVQMLFFLFFSFFKVISDGRGQFSCHRSFMTEE